MSTFWVMITITHLRFIRRNVLHLTYPKHYSLPGIISSTVPKWFICLRDKLVLRSSVARRSFWAVRKPEHRLLGEDITVFTIHVWLDVVPDIQDLSPWRFNIEVRLVKISIHAAHCWERAANHDHALLSDLGEWPQTSPHVPTLVVFSGFCGLPRLTSPANELSIRVTFTNVTNLLFSYNRNLDS